MPPIKELERRLTKVRQKMRKAGLSVFVVTDKHDILYLTGKEHGILLITMSCSTLFVADIFMHLYSASYNQRGYPHMLQERKKGTLKGAVRSLRAKKIGISNYDLRSIASKAQKKPIIAQPVCEARMIKTDYEMRFMRKAARMASVAMRYAESIVTRDITEIIAASRIQHRLYELGSDRPAFDHGMLLCSGSSSADIHARPRHHKIEKGPVVVDLGAVFGGYHSDMTRTLRRGRLTKKQSEMISLVQRAQDIAVDMAGPGISSGKLQDHVVGFLKENSQKLYHRLGHGVGLEIHELPSFGDKVSGMLDVGTVFTIEPGVYLPHEFGVRHEDTFHMTSRGPKRLT